MRPTADASDRSLRALVSALTPVSWSPSMPCRLTWVKLVEV